MKSLLEYIEDNLIFENLLDFQKIDDMCGPSDIVYDCRSVSLKTLVDEFDKKMIKKYIKAVSFKELSCLRSRTHTAIAYTFVCSDYSLTIFEVINCMIFNELYDRITTDKSNCAWTFYIAETPDEIKDKRMYRSGYGDPLDGKNVTIGPEQKVLPKGQGATFYANELLSHIKSYIPTTTEYKKSK